jgi:hypothetical protein
MRTLALVAALAAASPALALDKQGSAHGGAVGGDEAGGVNVSGTLLLGAAPYNPTYAARPDNTGRALLRYGAHFDVDLLGRKLSLPFDVSMFTDRTREGLGVLAPTEFDFIAGVTSTHAVGPGDLELGARVEHDRPVDQGTFTQTYVDARVRYLYSLAASFPRLARTLEGGDVAGWATLGVFAYNPSYAARPDNSGLALLRYALHTEVSVLDDLWSLGLDATMFTDREGNPLRPTELDFTVEAIFHFGAFEVHLAYERDLPLDRSGLVQQFVYLLGGWSFDVFRASPHPMTDRNPVPSP